MNEQCGEKEKKKKIRWVCVDCKTVDDDNILSQRTIINWISPQIDTFNTINFNGNRLVVEVNMELRMVLTQIDDTFANNWGIGLVKLIFYFFCASEFNTKRATSLKFLELCVEFFLQTSKVEI